MKKLSIVFIGVMFLLSLAGLSMAQEKATPGKSPAAAKATEPAKPDAANKAEGAKPKEAKKVTAKPSQYRMGGVITAIDAKANKIAIKQQRVKKERTVSLKMNKETSKKLSALKIGDSVDVWVSGGTITVLQKI
jgi:hypothetical protein